ncbi:phage tail protein [Paenibacillus rigui]|uniref:Phage tail protein n=1 Tax=Paenibacillus rigui TaxID=554312 RepID=A0A229UP49_9BACL|nr:phage tail protein [Paenibacillus rigui]OXM85045.1 phage tail protein [Paenibacillus rigui]
MAGAKVKNVSGAFRFKVEIKGVIVGGFSEVTGMQAETEVMEYQEGGLNTHLHYFPKHTKFSRIVLKRGLTQSPELWEWYESSLVGKAKRTNGSIILFSEAGDEVCRWNFFDAYPVKWNGPELNANSGSVAIESIEIVHHGLKTIFSK